MSQDPYKTLGVRPGASDAEVRAAYRHLVQLHHPDHNAGSPESARRFEEIQAAYARVRELRAKPGAGSRAGSDSRAGAGSTAATDPDLEARLAKMEHDVAAAKAAREKAVRDARAAAAAAAAAAAGAEERPGRPSDEELGYVNTDDSFGQIFTDALSELSDRLADARKQPLAGRVVDELEELASKLGRKRPRA
jgi:DnaJ-class molecular chaperone